MPGCSPRTGGGARRNSSIGRNRCSAYRSPPRPPGAAPARARHRGSDPGSAARGRRPRLFSSCLAPAVYRATGWGSRWRDRQRVLGRTKTGAAAVPALHFPGLILDAARELARRRVGAVGIDTPSIDYGQSKNYGVHRRLFAANIPAFENVAHIEQLPVTGAYVIALPMKITGGSGGPLRIVALLP